MFLVRLLSSTKTPRPDVGKQRLFIDHSPLILHQEQEQVIALRRKPDRPAITRQEPVGASNPKWTEFVRWLAFVFHIASKNPVRKKSEIRQDAKAWRITFYTVEL